MSVWRLGTTFTALKGNKLLRVILSTTVTELSQEPGKNLHDTKSWRIILQRLSQFLKLDSFFRSILLNFQTLVSRLPLKVWNRTDGGYIFVLIYLLYVESYFTVGLSDLRSRFAFRPQLGPTIHPL